MKPKTTKTAVYMAPGGLWFVGESVEAEDQDGNLIPGEMAPPRGVALRLDLVTSFCGHPEDERYTNVCSMPNDFTTLNIPFAEFLDLMKRAMTWQHAEHRPSWPRN